MNRYLPHSPRLGLLLAGADALAMAVALWLAHLLRFSASLRSAKLAALLDRPAFLVVALLALWALAVAAELYEVVVLRRGIEAASRLAVVALSWAGTLALATYLVPTWEFGRGLLVLTGLLWGGGAALVRWGVVRWVTSRPRPLALVVGEGAAVAALVRRLQHDPTAPWVGVDGAGVAPAELGKEVQARGAAMVIVAGQGGGVQGLPELSALHFSGVPVVLGSEVIAWLEGRLPLDAMAPEAFLHQPGFAAVHSQTFNRVTRVLDIVLGAVGAVVSLPVLLLAMVLVRVLDGRPVIFRQVRLGQYGRPFTLYKLRTMRRDAEENGPAFALPDDPRATRLGRVLRRLRIDELPQLVNVLKGEMSLVGPRPERPEFAVELAREIPYYAFRLVVPPGLTGWSQISMPYARTVAEHRQKLEYDLYFIRERSLRLYLVTLLRTATAALRGRGE
ncbi:MAG: sugar transferase [Thermoanaerobaculaceae bacterium]|nr:sugar transferase [Thermoanaerobaculaceae bacterium]